MKILFLGTKFGNSYLQYKSLKEIYKKVDFIDGYNCFKFQNTIRKFFVHLSPVIFQKKINNYILSKCGNKYDLIYVKSGELIGKELILDLKKITKKIIFFCNDNPFVERDKRKWDLFLQSGKYYDLIAFQDQSRIKLSKKFGIKKTILVLPPYDTRIHKRQKISKKNIKIFQNDIVFVGTWSVEKGKFIKKLISLGINIKVYGSRWNKDDNFKFLKPRIKLGHLNFKNYTKIIQCAKIALCLFSEQNLDTITARSIEIPAIGTLIFSKRTPQMKKIFIENKEAIFFRNADECAKKCIFYLNNPQARKRISNAGQKKITKILKPSNDMLIKKIIKTVFKK